MSCAKRVFLGLFVASLGLAVPASAKAPAVSVGSVRADRAELRPTLESLLRSELGKLDTSSAKDQFVLGAKLVTLRSVQSRGKIEVTCVVSADLVRKKGGALRAMLRGKARAVDAANSRRAAERAALEGAVRSVVRRVPEALD